MEAGSATLFHFLPMGSMRHMAKLVKDSDNSLLPVRVLSKEPFQ